MAWTTPRTWTTGELVTAAIMNTYVRDNQDYLYDRLFTEDWSAGHSVSSTSTWEDWDISAIVPAGTLFVQVRMFGGAAVANTGIRKNGSSTDRYAALQSIMRCTEICECDENRVIECYADRTDVVFYITGYW